MLGRFLILSVVVFVLCSAIPALASDVCDSNTRVVFGVVLPRDTDPEFPAEQSITAYLDEYRFIKDLSAADRWSRWSLKMPVARHPLFALDHGHLEQQASERGCQILVEVAFDRYQLQGGTQPGYSYWAGSITNRMLHLDIRAKLTAWHLATHRPLVQTELGRVESVEVDQGDLEDFRHDVLESIEDALDEIFDDARSCLADNRATFNATLAMAPFAQRQ